MTRVLFGFGRQVITGPTTCGSKLINRTNSQVERLLNITVKSKATMNPDIKAYNDGQATAKEREICETLATTISELLPEAECKIWHRHPVWFLDENPVVGYSKLKAGIRLMFWSGASFEEEKLKPGTGKFKDASVIFTSSDQIKLPEMKRWIRKSKTIQWDYKNVAKRKGKLVRLV